MQYKFRGKRIDNGEWVHGLLSKSFTESSKYASIGSYITEYIEDDLVQRGIAEYGVFNSHEVQPDSVGMKVEWNNKFVDDLYQGDIVQYNSTEGKVYVHEVWWSIQNASWCFGIMPIKQIVESGYFQGMNLKVIGNTTDNPELLEEI